MHNNYYFLRQLVAELNRELTGANIVDVYSQNKDELIIQFIHEGKEQNLVAHLTGQFTCLAFPNQSAKAKKNTATLFSEIIGAKVIGFRQFINERAFSIQFNTAYQLLFKLFGRQANIILFKDDQLLSLFRKGFNKDLDLVFNQFDRPLDQTLAALEREWPDFIKVFPTLNKRSIEQLKSSISTMPGQAGQTFLMNYIDQLKTTSSYSIVEQDQKVYLEPGEKKDAINVFKSPMQAITEFFYLSLNRSGFIQSQNQLLTVIDRSIGKTEVYLTKTSKKLKSLENDVNYHQLGDILMANLHQHKAGISEIILDNFYSNQPIKIKLNPKLNGQLNAERYYKKGKNLSIELDNLRATIGEKKTYLQKLKEQRELIADARSQKELRPFLKKSTAASTEKATPFKEFIIEGFTVYIGNNAKQNDLLTLKYAKKDDLFFHAKDVAGSHVILKHKSGQPFPNYLLEIVASLAAYYSKRRTDSLCPVGYTPKKYVRKPKGSPPGLVHVEREKVLLVKPGLPD